MYIHVYVYTYIYVHIHRNYLHARECVLIRFIKPILGNHSSPGVSLKMGKGARTHEMERNVPPCPDKACPPSFCVMMVPHGPLAHGARAESTRDAGGDGRRGHGA